MNPESLFNPSPQDLPRHLPEEINPHPAEQEVGSQFSGLRVDDPPNVERHAHPAGLESPHAESPYSPEETLDNVFNIAERFMRDARVIRAMIAEGKDRKLGISMGHHTLLEKFESGNEHHLTLLRLHNDLAQLKVYLAREGVLMTQEETEERLRVMEEKGEINPPSLDKLYR